MSGKTNSTLTLITTDCEIFKLKEGMLHCKKVLFFCFTMLIGVWSLKYNDFNKLINGPDPEILTFVLFIFILKILILADILHVRFKVCKIIEPQKG